MANTLPQRTSRETRTKREQYNALRGTLWNERSSFDAHWREIADYLHPVRPRFWVSDKNRGDRRNQKIINNTPVRALETLQSGLHAGLTSPARPWMKLSTPDPELAQFGPVKQWLYDVTERMLTVFQLSNLYNALPIVYGDMGAFGTAAMAVLDDPGDDHRSGDLMRCYPYPVGSYALGMDKRGLVTTFLREYSLTVGQLIEEFGLKENGKDIDRARFSQAVLNQWDRGNYEQQVEICWMVTPNREREASRVDYRSKPWLSCHFETGTGKDEALLRESGFWEFPIMAPAWEKGAEETYGTRCPGMNALGDIKALQIMEKRSAQAVEKQLNPPMQGPNFVLAQKVSIVPGDFTPVEDGPGRQGYRPLHETNVRINDVELKIQQTEYRIERAFYADLFLMLASSDQRRGAQPVTAREIQERHEEKLLALGPVLERTIDELLDPLVDRVFAMMVRAKLIPEPPPDLVGVDLTVEYISILAQAQKLVDVVANDRFMQTVSGLASMAPQVRHKVNWFAAVDKYADRLGIDPRLVHADDVANETVASEARAMQEQAAAEQAAKMGQAVHALGATPMQGDTALNRLIEGVA